MKAKLFYLHHDGQLNDRPVWTTDRPLIVIDQGTLEDYERAVRLLRRPAGGGKKCALHLESDTMAGLMKRTEEALLSIKRQLKLHR